jgi:hypothetical protein
MPRIPQRIPMKGRDPPDERLASPRQRTKCYSAEAIPSLVNTTSNIFFMFFRQ